MFYCSSILCVCVAYPVHGVACRVQCRCWKVLLFPIDLAFGWRCNSAAANLACDAAGSRSRFDYFYSLNVGQTLGPKEALACSIAHKQYCEIG